MVRPWRERGAVTIAEAGEILGVSPATVRRHYADRIVRIGAHPRVPVLAILEALGEVAPEEPRRHERIDREADRIADQLRRRAV